MKIITIEEHVLDPAVARASAATAQQLSPYFGAAFGPDSGLPYSPSADVLCDLDEGRIADTLVAAVRRHPDRFAAFAALPTTVPDAAAAELERCVGDLGFVGTMIMGRTEGEFLSAERFDPVLGGVFDRYPALQVILGH